MQTLCVPYCGEVVGDILGELPELAALSLQSGLWLVLVAFAFAHLETTHDLWSWCIRYTATKQTGEDISSTT